jgi:hypothetical protein
MTDGEKSGTNGNEKVTGPELEYVPFSKLNYILFAAGLLVITAGWFLLRGGHISIAPIMLILGYCGIIPLAIIIKQKKTE